MCWKTFESDAHLLFTITLEKLEQAHHEEENKLPIFDLEVCLLWKYIHATGSYAMASDHACYQLQSQIWSTSIYLNPLSL